MKRVLVAYATMAGSTAEVASKVAEVLIEDGYQVDLKTVQSVNMMDGYDAVVVGGPMILGWHREARRFLRRYQSLLEATPFAVFATAMSLTDTDERVLDSVPVFIDEMLAKPPENPSRLSLRERYATVSNYARPMFRFGKPASIAFFGGRLNYGRLKLWALLFAMLIVQGHAGDKRNWEAITGWAQGLPKLLRLEK